MHTPNKHAYLIIAHHQPQLLKMLCQLLDHPNHDIFIHISAKSDISQFRDIENCTKHSNIYFTPRTAISWGGYSQINCELLMLKTARSKGSYSYYHLISGVDMPIVSAQQLYTFFENSGRDFVQTDEGDALWQEKIKKRIVHYCIFQEKADRDNHKWLKRQDKLHSWQYRLGIDRTKSLGKKIMSGANWFSITDKLAEYVVANSSWIKKHFSNTVCADEVFLQTLISGTEFENNLWEEIPQKSGAKACMRLVDWQRGNPYTFTDEDFDMIINSGCMFARKFDIEKHPDICHRIFKHITNNI